MKMEGMIANTPCNGTFFTGSACLICLALNAEVHYVVSANCTIINHNIPCPEGNGIPFLDFEPFNLLGGSAWSGLTTGTLSCRFWYHLYVC
jgi:hypothetical protein